VRQTPFCGGADTTEQSFAALMAERSARGVLVRQTRTAPANC
jgi:hypothetical protein